jgi:threonine/homoserine/homoserine lactone efflux protein
MFEYTALHWGTFIAAAALLILSPGPTMAFILEQTARHGKSSGFAAMFGIWSGAFVHVVLAAAGLSAILASSATAFLAVKWLGAFVSGVPWHTGPAFERHYSHRDNTGTSHIESNSLYAGHAYRSAQPERRIVLSGFLPQFVVDGAGPVSAQLFLHGILIIAVAALLEPPLVLLGATLTRTLNKQPHINKWIDRGLGVLFIGLATRLALSDRI